MGRTLLLAWTVLFTNVDAFQQAVQVVVVVPSIRTPTQALHRSLSTALPSQPAPHFPDSSRRDNNNDTAPHHPASTHAAASSSSLWRKLDEYGLSLKPRAVQSESKAALATASRERVRYRVQSCLLYALFIAYRGYRGIFVILPAVFASTFDKLKHVVEQAPFEDDTTTTDTTTPTGLRTRTRLTVSVLAAIVTLSYALGGALRIGLSVLRGAADASWTESWARAAATQERHEAQLLHTTRTTTEGSFSSATGTGGVNGSSSSSSSGGGGDGSVDDIRGLAP